MTGREWLAVLLGFIIGIIATVVANFITGFIRFCRVREQMVGAVPLETLKEKKMRIEIVEGEDGQLHIETIEIPKEDEDDKGDLE